jgi:hypothetical protein
LSYSSSESREIDGVEVMRPAVHHNCERPGEQIVNPLADQVVLPAPAAQQPASICDRAPGSVEPPADAGGTWCGGVRTMQFVGKSGDIISHHLRN